MLLGTFIGMYALGIDLHKVSLGALIVALGMLVDDAIVVVELMEIKLAEAGNANARRLMLLKPALFRF